MKIEVVSHCYCPPGVNTYAQHLKWQWVSLCNFPTNCHEVTLMVCYTRSDSTTLDMAKALYDYPHPENVKLRGMDLLPSMLFRRAIGRNLVALESKADVVYFTDVDYFWMGGFFDAVAEHMSPESGLCMPSHIWIAKEHAACQELVESQRGAMTVRWKEGDFVRRKQRICIGGVQLVGGDFARRHGYLNCTKWVQPVDSSAGFRSCVCDRQFRAWRKKLDPRPTERLDLPHCYRLRHTMDGRDYDLNGVKIGRTVW